MKKAIIYGAGELGIKAFLRSNNLLKIVCFVDKNEDLPRFLLNTPIVGSIPEKNNWDYIIIGIKDVDFVRNRLKEIKINDEKILQIGEIRKRFKVSFFRRYYSYISKLLLFDFPVFRFFSKNFSYKNDASFKIKKISWTDSAKGSRQGILEKKSYNHVYFYQNYHKKKIKYSVPPLKYYLVHDVKITSSMGGYEKDNTVFIDRVNRDNKGESGYENKNLLSYGKKNALIYYKNHTPVLIEKGISLLTVDNTNYYHFLMECYSKKYMFELIPDEIRDYPLILSKEVLETPQLKQIVKNNFSEKIIFIEKDILYKFNKLLWITSPNYTLHNKRVSEIVDPSFYFHKKTVHKLREDFLKFKGIPTKRKKIFLARNKNYRKYNQFELIYEITKYGFEIIYCDNVSLGKQIELFSSATHIVGPPGGAWTNLIFVNKETKLLSWKPKNQKFNIFAGLSSSLDIRIDYVNINQENTNNVDGILNDYIINVSDILDWVEKN